MLKKVLKYGKKNLVKIFEKDNTDPRFIKLHEEKDYIEAYSKTIDLRVEEDPRAAVGGRWEEFGQLQFQFMVKKGMQPHHKMLDIGCGTLRGGRFAIDYLDKGNYYGMDISPKAIEFGKQLVKEEGLSNKTPTLLVSENKDLKFKEFDGIIFDYILAQSVFTHLKPEHIKECMAHIGNIMHEKSAFYFTYFKTKKIQQTGLERFKYPFSFFESVAEKNNFSVQDIAEQYKHPRGQRMAELKKAV